MDDDDIEEIQDWGSLNKQSQNPSAPNEPLPKDEALPKRSTKFFEKDGLHVQTSKLEHARDQMYVALLSTRGHHVKQKLQAVWISGQALVPHAKGGFFRDMGIPYVYPRKKKLQGVWLSAIETIYLVERGSLIIYESSRSFEHFLDNELQVFDFETLRQFSLSHIYSLAFAEPHQLDRYQVYALLKRLGYLVMGFREPDLRKCAFDPELPQSSQRLGMLGTFVSLGTAARRWIDNLPLPKSPLSSHFLTYTDVFQSLQITPTDLVPRYSSRLLMKPEYKIVFNVWKPSPAFSKKNPPCPDFQIGVLNTSQVPFPSLSILETAWDHLSMVRSLAKNHKQSTPKKMSKKKVSEKSVKPPTKKELRSQKRAERESNMDHKLLNRNNYLRARDQLLKMGSTGRSVIYAIIDHGIINFTTFSETHFKLETHVSELNELEPRSLHGIMWNEELN